MSPPHSMISNHQMFFSADLTDVICGDKPGELSQEQVDNVCNFQNALEECHDNDRHSVDKSPIDCVDDMCEESRESCQDNSFETCRTDDVYEDSLWSEFSDDQSTESSEIESESHWVMKHYKNQPVEEHGGEYGKSGVIPKALEGCTINKACKLKLK